MNNLTLHDPILSEMLADMYFMMAEKDNTVPTVPGFALAIGFNTTKDITNTLTDYETDSSKYPEQSISLILRALTRIEDHYLQNGMKNKFPAALVKFCLGAYHDRQEKEPPKQLSEHNNFTIVFEQPKQLDAVQARQLQAQAPQAAQPVIEMNYAN